MYMSLLPSLGAKVYGCALPGSEGSGEPQILYPQQAEGFLFAPRDVAPLQFEGKEDIHGIGYSGMEERGVLHSQKTTRALYGMMGEVGVKEWKEGLCSFKNTHCTFACKHSSLAATTICTSI